MTSGSYVPTTTTASIRDDDNVTVAYIHTYLHFGGVMMLGGGLLGAFLLVAAVSPTTARPGIAPGRSVRRNEDAAAAFNSIHEAGSRRGPGPWRIPSYVRMPVAREHFNVTGRGALHARPPGPSRPPLAVLGNTSTENPVALAARQAGNPRKWGWAGLEELGGIAYIIERKSPPSS